MNLSAVSGECSTAPEDARRQADEHTHRAVQADPASAADLIAPIRIGSVT